MSNFIIPHLSLINIIEIVLLAFIVYYVAKAVQGTRIMILLKGFAFMGGVYALAVWLDLHVLQTILLGFFVVAAFTMVIVFNSEIRRFIEGIGTKITKANIMDIFKNNEVKKEYFSADTIRALADAVVYMSERKTGALIVLQKDVPIDDVIQTGLSIDAKVSSQLLINIFEKNTPLHDGAVVISDNKVTAATCILPLTQQAIDRRFGTRHRAAIGVSEASDCCVLVVSEETGGITFVYNNGQHSPLKDRSEVMTKLKSIQEKPEDNEERKNAFLERTQHNFSLKLISSMTAAVIWATITLVNDPMTSVSYNVAIQPINEAAITEIGQIYELTQDKVKVTVKTRTSMLGEFSAEDVDVFADMSKLSYTNAVPLIGTIENLNTSEYELVLGVDSINILLDELTVANVPIKIETKNKVADGFCLSNIEPVDDNITIKCGATLAKTIDAAYVLVDLNNMNESGTYPFGYVLKDKNGTVISSQNYTSRDTCDVELSIKPTKTIPVNVVVSDALKEVYNIEEPVLDRTEIIVIGSEEKLNGLNEYKIEINTIEITDPAVKKYIKTATISLPEGIAPAEGFETVTIELALAPEATKTIELKAEDIEIKALKDGLELEINNETIYVGVYGTEEEVNKINAEELKAYISAEDLSEGQYNLLVQLGAKIYASTATANVTITKGES